MNKYEKLFCPLRSRKEKNVCYYHYYKYCIAVGKKKTIKDSNGKVKLPLFANDIKHVENLKGSTDYIIMNKYI